MKIEVMEDVYNVMIEVPAAGQVVPVRVPARNDDEARSRALEYVQSHGHDVTEEHIRSTFNMSREIGYMKVPVMEEQS